MQSAQFGEVARRPYWRERDAHIIVEAWRRAGESMAAFAHRHGLDPQRLGRWVARLKGAKAAPVAAVQFHPVRLAPSTPVSSGTIEIELRDGARLRVSRGFDEQDLRRVLVVLGERPTC